MPAAVFLRLTPSMPDAPVGTVGTGSECGITSFLVAVHHFEGPETGQVFVWRRTAAEITKIPLLCLRVGVYVSRC